MARMDVIAGELPLSRELYRDFVVIGRSKAELFSARLMEAGDSLQVTWTASLRLTTVVNHLGQVQDLAGGPGCVMRIWGKASADLQAMVRSGRFNAPAAAQALGQRLGGNWRIDLTRVPNSVPPTWEISATRLKESP